MKNLVELMYPSHSSQRRELREEWNKQDSLSWEKYLLTYSFYRANALVHNFLLEEDRFVFLTDLNFYNMDWNKLMPVIDKIERLGYRFEMSSSPEAGGSPPIPRGYGFVAFTLPKGQISSAWKPEITEEQATIGNWATTRINATYLAIVEFIFWYNENK